MFIFKKHIINSFQRTFSFHVETTSRCLNARRPVSRCVFIIINRARGSVDHFSIFFNLVLFFVDWISLYFFHILQNATTLCLLLLGRGRPSGLLFFRARFATLHTRTSILVSLCLLISFLLFPCASGMHEFRISYSHTEWY